MGISVLFSTSPWFWYAALARLSRVYTFSIPTYLEFNNSDIASFCSFPLLHPKLVDVSRMR